MSSRAAIASIIVLSVPICLSKHAGACTTYVCVFGNAREYNFATVFSSKRFNRSLPRHPIMSTQHSIIIIIIMSNRTLCFGYCSSIASICLSPYTVPPHPPPLRELRETYATSYGRRQRPSIKGRVSSSAFSSSEALTLFTDCHRDGMIFADSFAFHDPSVVLCLRMITVTSSWTHTDYARCGDSVGSVTLSGWSVRGAKWFSRGSVHASRRLISSQMHVNPPTLPESQIAPSTQRRADKVALFGSST